eukprot:1335126-Rhodomonas_salina.1
MKTITEALNLYCTVASEHAGKGFTACYARCGEARTQLNLGQIITHLVRDVTNIVGGCSLSQGVREVEPPTFCTPVVEQCTAAILPTANSDGRSAAAEVDACGRNRTHAVGIVATIHLIPYAKLTMGVVAPALDTVVVQNCARMLANNHGGDQRGSTRTKIDGLEIRDNLVRHVTKGIGKVGVLPQSSKSVASPALHCCIRAHDASRIDSRRNARSSTASNLHCRKRVSHLVCVVSAVIRIANAELPPVVVSPALD